MRRAGVLDHLRRLGARDSEGIHWQQRLRRVGPAHAGVVTVVAVAGEAGGIGGRQEVRPAGGACVAKNR